jgi:hypothetical protein
MVSLDLRILRSGFRGFDTFEDDALGAPSTSQIELVWGSSAAIDARLRDRQAPRHVWWHGGITERFCGRTVTWFVWLFISSQVGWGTPEQELSHAWCLLESARGIVREHAAFERCRPSLCQHFGNKAVF